MIFCSIKEGEIGSESRDKEAVISTRKLKSRYIKCFFPTFLHPDYKMVGSEKYAS